MDRTTETCVIRPATPADVPTLLELVHALAEYEREAASARATAEDFLRHGFGERPAFEAFIALWDGEPVGFSLHFFTFSTWTGRPSLFLEDLFVQPTMRGKGLGKALLVNLARIAVARGCARFEWQVMDWNTPSIEFYEALGARGNREWIPFRIDGPALERLARSTTVVD